MQLQNVVVLLDEVEEFCLDHSNAQLGMESRALTTVLKVPVLERRSPPTPPCHLGPLGSRWLPTLPRRRRAGWLLQLVLAWGGRPAQRR